jgi:hypothetical protein
LTLAPTMPLPQGARRSTAVVCTPFGLHTVGT